jgi:two-component system nitrate/nitrite response regulator NarL
MTLVPFQSRIAEHAPKQGDTEEPDVSQAIRMLIVDDHRLCAECLSMALSATEGFGVVGISETGEEAFKHIALYQPDAVVLAYHLEQLVFKLINRITIQFPKVKVIVYGVAEADPGLLRCIEAGASGYILQDASFETLRFTIERVLQGDTICSPRVAYSVFARLAELASEGRELQATATALTSREIEILHLIAEGLSNKEIAVRLALSVSTVKNHVHNILEKLKLQTRLQAVEYAYEKRWLRRGVG